MDWCYRHPHTHLPTVLNVTNGENNLPTAVWLNQIIASEHQGYRIRRLAGREKEQPMPRWNNGPLTVFHGTDTSSLAAYGMLTR